MDTQVAKGFLASARPFRSKILSIDEIAAAAGRIRQDGGVVVLAHGTFDLLHLGHVRHLESARAEGSSLIVTLTADEFVNKGPGRPIFTDTLRAEMIAALEFVDYVGVSKSPTAIPVIGRIQPDVYVKGQDYNCPADDPTGNIERECAAVGAYGGRVVFTDVLTFSSSALINRYLGVHSPEVTAFLAGYRNEARLSRLLSLLEQIGDYRVLLVGDTIIDEYAHVAPLGKPSKENIIATLAGTRETFGGGVIAAANHVSGFCKSVDVLTMFGDDEYLDLVQTNLRQNVTLTALRRKGMPTTRKLRFLEEGYLRKLFEVYYMEDAPLSDDLDLRLCSAIQERAAEYDVVIVTDFGHGLITRNAIRALVENSNFLAVNAQTNSANTGFNLITKYPRADYICLDGPEARLAVADKHGRMEDVASISLPARISCPRIIVTTGRDGCIFYERDNGVARIPAFTQAIVDTIGAGDAFLAVTAPLAKCAAQMEDVAFIGNAVGAIKVGIVGHRNSVERATLIKHITGLLK